MRADNLLLLELAMVPAVAVVVLARSPRQSPLDLTPGELFRGALVVFAILIGALGGVHMCYRGSPVVGTEVLALTALGVLPWMAPGGARLLVAIVLMLAGLWFPFRFAMLVHEPDLVGNPKAVPKTEGAVVPAWHTWFSGVYFVDHSKAVVCNQLVNDAPLMASTSAPGDAPRPSGGQIRPGHYHLVSSVSYRMAPPPPPTKPDSKMTLELHVDGARLVADRVSTHEDRVYRTTSEITVNGSHLIEKELCPGDYRRDPTEDEQYEATDDKLTIWSYGTVVETFVRQP